MNKDNQDSKNEKGIDRRQFLRAGGRAALYLAGLSLFGGLNAGCAPQKKLDKEIIKETDDILGQVMKDKSLDGLVNDLARGTNKRLPKAPNMATWTKHRYDDNQEKHQQLLNTILYMTETTERCNSFVETMQTQLGLQLNHLAGYKHILKQKDDKKKATGLQKVLLEVNQKEIANLKKVFSDYAALEGKIRQYGKVWANGVAELDTYKHTQYSGKRAVSNKTVNKKLDQLKVAYKANLTQLQAMLQAQIMMRSIEGLFDKELDTLIDLSDNVQLMLHGKKYTTIADDFKVYGGNLETNPELLTNNPHMKKALRHFQKMDSNYLHDVYEDNRFPVAQDSKKKLDAKQIPPLAFFGSLLQLDKELVQYNSNVTLYPKDRVAPFINTIVRAFPVTAPIDMAVNQVPHLSRGDTVAEQYSNPMKAIPATWLGLIPPEHYVGAKAQVYQRFGLNIASIALSGLTWSGVLSTDGGIDLPYKASGGTKGLGGFQENTPGVQGN